MPAFLVCCLSLCKVEVVLMKPTTWSLKLTEAITHTLTYPHTTPQAPECLGILLSLTRGSLHHECSKSQVVSITGPRTVELTSL
jgi:hypothetical protein